MIAGEMVHDCESVGEVAFELDEGTFAGLGRVVFEVRQLPALTSTSGLIEPADEDSQLKLMRQMHSEKPEFRIEGVFLDKMTGSVGRWTLYRVLADMRSETRVNFWFTAVASRQ